MKWIGLQIWIHRNMIEFARKKVIYANVEKSEWDYEFERKTTIRLVFILSLTEFAFEKGDFLLLLLFRQLNRWLLHLKYKNRNKNLRRNQLARLFRIGKSLNQLESRYRDKSE